MEFLPSFLRRHLAGKPEVARGVAKCRLFSQATPVDAVISSLPVFLFCWFASLIYSQP